MDACTHVLGLLVSAEVSVGITMVSLFEMYYKMCNLREFMSFDDETKEA